VDAGKIPAGSRPGAARLNRPQRMDIDVKESSGVAVVAVNGDIDMAVADEVRNRLMTLVDQGRVRLVLDLARVLYIDSAGLGALVASMKHARAAGGDIKACTLDTDVRALFQMTRLDNVMDIHATRQEAIAAWK
jgi:anti-sigma B factor antagonist